MLFEKLSKLGIALLVGLFAFVLYLAVTTPFFQIVFYTIAVLILTIIAVANALYYSTTKKHYFVFIDEKGEIIAVKTKRLSKNIDKTAKVDLYGRIFEINPVKTYHLLSNFTDTEIKLIDTKEAIAKADIRQRQSSMLDLTVKSLTMLFRSTDLIFYLLLLTVVISSVNLFFTLAKG